MSKVFLVVMSAATGAVVHIVPFLFGANMLLHNPGLQIIGVLIILVGFSLLFRYAILPITEDRECTAITPAWYYFGGVLALMIGIGVGLKYDLTKQSQLFLVYLLSGNCFGVASAVARIRYDIIRKR